MTLGRGECELDFLIIGGLLFLLYQSGQLAPLGLIPSRSLYQSPTQALANQISAEEQAAYGQTQNQAPGQSGAVGIGAGVLSGFQAGAETGNPYVGAGTAIGNAITSLFNGMALRAKQATLENQALNYAVAAFDQALAQVNAAYNNRSITPQDAIALIQQIYQQYWGVTSTKIQPNRNGCSSGSNCPGTAMQYESTNGVPQYFCSNTNGATCCVGCGPIRLSVERCVTAIQQGGGQVTIAPIGGDHYGLQTRFSYILNWGPSL